MSLIPGPLTINYPTDQQMDILAALEGYRIEAEENRRSGLNPRDTKWEDNTNLYWNRFDFTKKADWQSREVLPEVPAYVDRFAGALKEALTTSDFYTVTDPYDVEGDLTGAVKRMNDVWLSTSGRNQVGTPLDFPAFFEEQMKMGALTAMSAVVLWKNDVPGGRVAFETVDPRFVWLDHTYRDLYRLRRVELDTHELAAMIDQRDNRGNFIFNQDEMARMVTDITIQEQKWKEEMRGSGQETRSQRKPVTLDEWIATVVGRDGRLIGKEHQLYVVGNQKFLLRGPETNPFWHGRDWLVYSPMVTAPQSVYGRSYMEDFGSIAKTFNELTNLILDAVKFTSIPMTVMVADMLVDVNQANSGAWPGKNFILEDGYKAEDFMKSVDLGTVDVVAMQLWDKLKMELTEAAGINQIGLGQFAPNSRTSATEISETQQSSSALVRSVAQTVETRFLNPLLDLGWKTGMQHVSPNDSRMRQAAGPELFDALMSDRRNLVKRNYSFQARGISAIIAKGQMLQKLMQLLQIVSQNEALMAAFMQRVDVNKFLSLIFTLSNVDFTKIEPSARQMQINDIMGQLTQAAGGATPAEGPQADAMGQAMAAAGIGG